MSNQRKIIELKTTYGWGMFDPLTHYVKFDDGTTEEIEQNGHNSCSPKEYLEKCGYIVDCESSD
jgi:hypothetical protein